MLKTIGELQEGDRLVIGWGDIPPAEREVLSAEPVALGNPSVLLGFDCGNVLLRADREVDVRPSDKGA